jgi:hypothetical protein
MNSNEGKLVVTPIDEATMAKLNEENAMREGSGE